MSAPARRSRETMYFHSRWLSLIVGVTGLWWVAGVQAQTARTACDQFWLSTRTSSQEGREGPTIRATSIADRPPALEVWGRPADGHKIVGFALNLVALDASVIQLTNVQIMNPTWIRDGQTHQRFDRVFTPPIVAASAGPMVASFGGFTLFHDQPGFDGGFGPSSRTQDRWHLATISYEILREGETDLFLEVGAQRVLHAGQTDLSDNCVFLGREDEALGGIQFASALPIRSRIRDGVVQTVFSMVADMNGDQTVDAADAATVFSDWGRPGLADFNSDQVIDALDGGIMFAEWSTADLPLSTAETSHFVPEACSCWLLATAGAILVARRSPSLAQRKPASIREPSGWKILSRAPTTETVERRAPSKIFFPRACADYVSGISRLQI